MRNQGLGYCNFKCALGDEKLKHNGAKSVCVSFCPLIAFLYQGVIHVSHLKMSPFSNVDLTHLT